MSATYVTEKNTPNKKRDLDIDVNIKINNVDYPDTYPSDLRIIADGLCGSNAGSIQEILTTLAAIIERRLK